MMDPQEDTIIAIATPIGEGAISVIRVSGTKAIDIVDTRFRGRQSLLSVGSHTAHVGHIVDSSGSFVDEVVATVFREPHSYTAEDSVEVSCHGGILVTKRVLESIVDAGARMAEPGEFTKRAFLNGRIDLSRAEAVADIIRSKSDRSLRASLSQLEGSIHNNVEHLRESLLKICSLLELEIDFSEEGIELGDRTTIESDLKLVAEEITKMAQSYDEGRIYREGVKVSLAGKPNVGKSSIFNYLINSQRAIVTPIPGTTRDTIEESLVVDGIIFNLIDTAGLRSTTDLVENEGIKLTERSLRESTIRVYVVDATIGVDQEDLDYISQHREADDSKSCNWIVVANKIDLVEPKPLTVCIPGHADLSVIAVSAKTGEGIDVLKTKLKDLALPADINEGSCLVTNARHKSCLMRSKESLDRALSCLSSRGGNEIIAIELRESLSELERIVGIITTDDVLNSIFSKFCIGK